jgi:hypothetical protein
MSTTRHSSFLAPSSPSSSEYVVLEREKGNNHVREMREIMLMKVVHRGIEGRSELTVIVAGGRRNPRACELACKQPGSGLRGKSGKA